MYRSVRKLSTGSNKSNDGNGYNGGNESNGGNGCNESNDCNEIQKALRSFYEKGTGIFCGRHGRN